MKQEKGFVIVSALVIVVMLAVFGIAMSLMGTLQQRQSALDLDTARAYQAAKTGIDWSLYQIQNPAAPPVCQSISFNAGGELSRFTITVSCTRTAVNDGTTPLLVYVVQSNACNNPTGGACPGTGSGALAVERQLRVVTYR